MPLGRANKDNVNTMPGGSSKIISAKASQRCLPLTLPRPDHHVLQTPPLPSRISPIPRSHLLSEKRHYHGLITSNRGEDEGYILV